MTYKYPIIPKKTRRPNKYFAKKTLAFGEKFDSKWEAERWGQLKAMERAGVVDQLERQVKYELTINDIKSIRGFSDKTALAIVDGLKKFREFLEEHPYFNINTLEPVEIKLVTNNPLVNKTIVLTGIRDPTVNTFCETISGCKIGSAINSKVDFIVVPNSQYSNKKTQAALELGIVKLSLDEFKSKFMA